DAVRDTLFDVKLEDDMTDTPDRRFRRRKLLQNGDAETRLLDHLPNAAELSLDALQSREDVALMLDVQRGRARRARGSVDYSMRIHSASCDLFFGHLMRLTAWSARLFTGTTVLGWCVDLNPSRSGRDVGYGGDVTLETCVIRPCAIGRGQF